MTILWQMNCPHSADAWCLACVAPLGAEVERLQSLLPNLAAILNSPLVKSHLEEMTIDEYRTAFKEMKARAEGAEGIVATQRQEIERLPQQPPELTPEEHKGDGRP